MKKRTFLTFDEIGEHTFMDLCVLVSIFILFPINWFIFGTFWGALILTILGSFFLVGIPVFFILIICAFIGEWQERQIEQEREREKQGGLLPS